MQRLDDHGAGDAARSDRLAQSRLPSRVEANLRVNWEPVSGTGHGIAVPVVLSTMAPVRPVTGGWCGTTGDGDMIEE